MKYLIFFLEVRIAKRKTINSFITIFKTQNNLPNKDKILFKIMIKNRLTKFKNIHPIYQYLKPYNLLQHFQDCQLILKNLCL